MSNIQIKIMNLLMNYKHDEAYNLLKSNPKVNINYADGLGNTILMKLTNYWAYEQEELKTEFLKFIIKKGAVINHKNIHGRTALQNVLDDCNLNAIRTLIHSGAVLFDTDPKYQNNPYNACYYLTKSENNFNKLFPIFQEECNTEEKLLIFEKMYETYKSANHKSRDLEIQKKFQVEIENYISKKKSYYQLEKSLDTNHQKNSTKKI